MMDKLTRDDLFTLEKYAEVRKDFRAGVLEHKKNRQLPLGTNATLYFEDRLTMQYQIQEMLRIERIFEAAGINEELEAYNPLIPDGANWKATFMVEFPDIEERRAMLASLVGIEARVWLKVGDGEKIRPIADEDLDRTDEDKTSAVHFLRFEITDQQIADLRGGAKLSAGIDHPNYQVDVDPIPDNVRQSLIGDLS
jgi:hypothetical protein